MRNKRAVRLVAYLSVFAIASVSLMGSTYAKYMTGTESIQSARVAKFGVEVEAEGALFSQTYINYPQKEGDLTVVSSNGDEIVAPGTKSDDNGLRFTITGTPEVDVKVEVKLTGISDIFLAKTTGNQAYKDYSAIYPDGNFQINRFDYHPIVFNLYKGVSKDQNLAIKSANLQEIGDYITKELCTTYKAGTNLSDSFGTYILTWHWDYGQTSYDTGHDSRDTLLGELAANKNIKAKTLDMKNLPVEYTTLEKGTDFSTDIKLELSITVTQVD